MSWTISGSINGEWGIFGLSIKGAPDEAPAELLLGQAVL
jgi:hypothetical protein